MMKKIKHIYNSKPQSVGDGFIGKNAISMHNHIDFSPFLMLDHHGPMEVKPSEIPKGVDEHPHRGIETITLVFEGALQHRDSAGNKGTLQAGDMQWMTAASGIVHEEKHELEFSRKGGTLNFIQLWTNLPARYKMTPPRYQEIASAKIPVTEFQSGVQVKVFAGELAGQKGPAQTYTPMTLADFKTDGKKSFSIDLPEKHNTGIYVITGEVKVNNETVIKAGQIVSFDLEGNQIDVATEVSAHFLLMGGEPIQEAIVSYGPFVMNTQAEIMQAIQDYQLGKMGHLD